MKLKLLITILVLAALFSGVVLWRVDRFVFGDRMAWAEAQARSQVSSISQAINSEIQSARRMLGTVSNDSFKRETANWKAFQPYYALALMTNQGGSLGISRMVSKADSPAAAWTANELSQYIGFMGKELESRGTVLLRAFKDPEKNHHIAVIFAGGGNAYILVGSGENFQSLIESQKGSLSSFSIIASDGLMIGHQMQDYIGSVMSDSTMLKEIRSTGASHGLGAYMQGKDQIFGMYELVPGTNTYVISTVPIAELMKGRLSLAWQFAFMLIGLCFIGAAIYFWQERKAASLPSAAPSTPAHVMVAATPAPSPKTSYSPDLTPPPKSPKDIPTAPMPAPKPAPGPSVVTAVENLAAPIAPKKDLASMAPAAALPSVPMAPHEIQAEKNEAYRQVATALGQELRAPLASILGFSQMVLAKTQEPEVVQAVESILREARSSRDVLEKLYTFSGERSSEKTEARIEGPLMQALKNLEAKIQQKGVKIEKDFKETSPWPMANAEVTKAFENILTNSIEAMERMQDKVIKISTWESGEGLHVQVSDTGEGIEMDNLTKVFDPFFTTRSFAQHVGLGLPVVVGILKEHQAQIQIQSQRGKGTQVNVVFAAVAKKTDVAANGLPKPPMPPPVRASELPADLPKVSAPSHEDVAVHEAAQQEVAQAAPKLTDMNVDSLLELSGDDMPLQFLDGQGFDEPPPAIPLPQAAVPKPTKPAVAPPQTMTPPTEEIPEMKETPAEEMTVSMSPPPKAPPLTPQTPSAIPQAIAAERVAVADNEKTAVMTPPAFTGESEDEQIADATRIVPSVVIDKPAAPPMMTKKTELDSYKVEVRRPGKRT
ncbi:ATP-binding protein [Bdellovibrio sp. HCB337]|uniref:ATP-binding protein n=1 Tax=Bdellovibrio sp. HCB337 TaxID=3394358 RepID=UPI0039A45C46